MTDATSQHDTATLSWIADFWATIGPLVILRDEDDVLILPPNRVYKVNSTGSRLIHWLMDHGSFDDLPGLSGERVAQVDAFFQNLRRAMNQEIHSARGIPYSFDFSRLPILGEIAVTYRCNNRCRFCYAGCDGACGRLDSADSPASDLKRIIDIFKDEAKIPFFSFTGGEPLMRDDLEELMAYACERGLKINLVTNGCLATPERAKSLYDAGLRTAQISLESPEEAVHDALCGRAGAWKQTIKGIENLRDAGILVQTNSTSTTKNIDTLPGLPRLVKDLGGIRMSINLFIPTDRSPVNDELFIPYTKIGPVIDRVRDEARKVELEFHWYSPIPICIYNPIAKGLGNKSCAACDGLISVDPTGNVLPCSSWDEPVGNLLRDGFHNTWFGARANAIKNKCFAPTECNGCTSFTACQSACPLYWKYAGTDELKQHAAQYKQKSLTDFIYLKKAPEEM